MPCKKPVPTRKPKELPQLDERPGPRKPRPHCCRRALKDRQVPRGRFFPPPGKLPAIREDITEFWEPCEYDSDGDYVSDEGDCDSDYSDYDSYDGEHDFDYSDFDDFDDSDDDDELRVTLLKGMEYSIIYSEDIKGYWEKCIIPLFEWSPSWHTIPT